MTTTYLHTAQKHLLVLLILICASFSVKAQIKEAFEVRYQNNIRGDLLFIANNIVNRNTVDHGINTHSYCDPALSDSELPNTEYNTLGSTSLYNDCLYMEYIDIDGDASTFSSSSASLTIPDISCSRVRYAGLYWAANYQYNVGDDSSSGRNSDFNQVKFRVPGGSYVDITADDVIYDGFGDVDFGATSPYACYADVTDLVTALANPEGNYFVGNIRASEGYVDSGVSGGWTMVVVFENPSYPGKYITSFDGFAGIAAGNTTDIDYNGFITLPAPFPVRAKFLSATLEGDNRITGDQLSIRANSNATFTNLGTNSAALPNFSNNFFDSNITFNHTIQTNRNPNSVNTLGFDVDQFDIQNPFNSVIPNDETGATLRASSTGDQYFVFLNALDVEIIEPKIILYKNVEDLAGNDIANQNVTLGQQIEYVLNFENIGNDDATNYTIRDVFPNNTIFIESLLQLPAGVTYVYDPVLHQITLTIPDYLVEAGDPLAEIRIRMQIVETCSDLRDACSNIIQNLAYSTYRGVLNSNQITDDPSLSDFDVCGFGVPGSTNFLIGLDECDFVQTVALCGSGAQITAGSGYDTYVWRDSSGNIIGNTQTITVASAGTYIVTKSGSAPCQSFDETVVVTNFSDTTTNPVIPYADEVVICPNDGDELPKIFLCGVNDSRFIDTDITNAQSIEWQVLDENSCSPIGNDDCANKDSTCSWTTLSTLDSFDATTAGQYRIVVYYQNGCFSRFYFNVYENLLDPGYQKKDIICNSPGEILITNVPTGYEFQLVNQLTGAVLVDYQTSSFFTIPNAGIYTVNIRQINVGAGACQFSIPDIGIRERNFQMNTIVTNQSCNTLGSIRVQGLDVLPQYYYEISRNGTTIDTYGPTNNNDYTFTNLSAGIYDVTLRTDDGCILTRQVEILNDSNLALTARVSQHITCREGNILVNPSGGKPPYQFAIWTYNGAIFHPGVTNVSDLPASAFQTSTIFDIWDPGDYVFVVVDRFNCFAFSNEVTIILEPAVEYSISSTDETCFGANDGSITISVTDGKGYNVDFSIDGGNTYRSPNTFTNLPPGTYTVIIRATKAGYVCPYPETITIAPAPELFGDAEITQPYTCLNDGEIQVISGSVSGGTPPYEYSIDGINFSTNTVFGGLTNGTYTVTVRDANGCTIVTDPMTLDPLNQPTDLTFSATPLTCPALTSDITVNVVGGNTPFVYEIIAPAANAVNNGSSNVFTNLGPGTYTFLVTDDKGCNITENYTINTIPQIQVNGQLISNITCFGDNNGALNFAVSGFVSTYTYTIQNSSSTVINSGTNVNASTIPLNSLSADTYTINVTDDTTNCTDTAVVSVSEPPSALDFSFTATLIDCNSLARIVVNATGGWGNYTYQLENATTSTIVRPYQTSNVFDNLNAGDYNIYVQDANGCVVAKPHTIDPAINPSVTIAANSVCLDGSIITITATASGVAPLQYSLNGSAYQTSNVFNITTSGNYTVTVSDANGCMATSNTISIANQISATAQLVKDLDCSASPDAEMNVTVNGGTSPFTYEVSFNGGAFTTVTLPYFTSASGNYQFQVTDAEGCQALTNVITINPITNPSATATATNVQCNGDANGVVNITIDTNFGTPPYQVSFNGGPYSSQTTYGNLTAGSYNYTIRDSKLCTFTDTVNITEPNALIASLTANPTTCDATGTVSGSIDVTLTGTGTAPYNYFLYDSSNALIDSFGTTSATSHSFINLSYGYYYVVIIDGNNCEYRSPRTQVESPPFLNLTGQVIASDCISGGTMEITVTGGTAPYTFSIYGSGTPPTTVIGNVATFTGLTPGLTYIFEVIDAVGCTAYLDNQFVASPSAITVTLDTTTNVDCNGANNGSIDFTVSGYDATVTDINYDVLYASNNTIVAGFSGMLTGPLGGPVSGTVTGLPPGDYVLLVEENTGTTCSATVSLTITEPIQVLGLVEVSNTNANCNSGAQVVVNAFGGTPPYIFAFVEDGVVPVIGDYSSTNLASLDPSINTNWDVYVQDANGCETFIDVTIAADTTPSLTLPPFADDQCSSNGTSYTFTVTPGAGLITPVSYSIGNGYQSSPTFTVSAPGTYTVTIRDGNGCTAQDTIDIYPPLSVLATVTAQPSCIDNDGIITVNPSGGSGSYTFVLLDSSMNPTPYVISGSDFTGLPSGDYFVEVTDTISSCAAQVPISLELARPVVFTLNTQDVSCNAGGDGYIEVLLDASNDNPPYTYMLDDGSTTITQNSPLFNNLSAGNYTITVTSGRNCVSSQFITIVDPTAVSATATVTPFSCAADNSVNTATLTINASDGTPSYLYSIDSVNYFTSNTFDIIDTGLDQTITYTVRDSNNCEFSGVVTISTLIPITTSITVDTSISCAGGEVITITASGGSGDFTFEVLPVGSQAAQTGTSATFTLPLISDYTIRVTDNTTGCYVDANHTVNPYPLIDIVASVTAPVNCFGDTTGEITVSIANYSGPYTYELIDSSGATASSGSGDTSTALVITNVPAGIYTVNITQTNSPFCVESSNAVTITSPDSAVIVSLNTTAEVTCNNDGGALTAIGSGGTIPYVYELVNTTTSQTIQSFGSNNSFENLPSGDYLVTIRDANGCTSTANATLTQPIPISASISATPTSLLCYGDTNASVSAINITGGQGVYQYILNYVDGSTAGPQQSNVFNNLGAGTYSITVTDGLNCDFTTPTVTITEPTPIVPSLIQLSGLTCTTDGSLQLSATGGTPPYQYSTDGINYIGSFNASVTISPVSQGAYQYYVRDANGCEAGISNQVTIDPVDPLTINVDLTNAVINCTGDATAVIIASASGGLGNYTYELLDSPTAITPLQGPQTTGTFTDYPAGTYYIRVVSGDCLEVSAPITIIDPEPLVIDSQSVTNVSCLGQDDGTITVEASGGNGVIKYAITPNLDQFDTVNTFTDLAPGSYEVIVQDENGCYIDLLFDIIEPTPLNASAITILSETCAGDNDAFIEVEVTGGTAPYFTSLNTQDDNNFVQDQFAFSNLPGGQTHVIFVRDSGGCDAYVIVDVPAAANVDAVLEIENLCVNNSSTNSVTVILDDSNLTGVTYALDNGTPQLQNVFNDLISGDHFIEVIHTSGCSKIYDFTIQAYEPLVLTLAETNINEITAIATGGAGDYEFFFNNISTGSNNVYRISQTGTYNVRVVDALGCEAVASIYVEFVDICIPNFFTPDGDGNNDTWAPCNAYGFPNVITKIYDRYGRIVARLSKVESWDGRYNGNELPTGDYWYVITLNQNNDRREFVGHFTLYR
ncbi:gliding motility-associated-like protein [Flavobacteriaceae bacterium MAR_2010_72]|nr:gliding motility-associated-like protein [Flavobacteriaceae bacterium MAR_2010_72]